MRNLGPQQPLNLSKCWMSNYPLCLSANYLCVLLVSSIFVVSVQGVQTLKREVEGRTSCWYSPSYQRAVSVYWPWKNTFLCNQMLCGTHKVLFLHKICLCVINGFCLHCMYSSTKQCTARDPSFPEDISSQCSAFSAIIQFFLCSVLVGVYKYLLLLCRFSP